MLKREWGAESKGSCHTYKSLEKLQTWQGCSRRNSKWEENLRQKKILDDSQHYDKRIVEDTNRKAEKRVEWRMLSLQ